VLLLGPGCSGGGGADTEVVESSTAPAELLAQSWVVQLAAESSLGVFASEPGWAALVMQRDQRAATQGLGRAGGVPAARAHTEAAFLYRQAALMSASGLIEVYGKTPEPTDPVGTAHLLTVSYLVTNQFALARQAADKLAAVTDDPTLPWHAPWKAWMAGKDDAALRASWPPDLSGLPVTLPPPTPGTWPELDQVPHYSLPEREGSTASRDMADPSALVALALWHDAAAAQASPEGARLAKALRAGYALPIELAPAAPTEPLPLELLFGSDLLVPGDAAFLVDVLGDQGPSAIDQHTQTSLLAWLAARARKDGKVNAELAVDEVTLLREALLTAAAARTDQQAQAHQRNFAGIAYVGALRSLALVAEREGDREASGILRINALEHSDKERACPIGMLALAAWDASNRYPMRAQDILHNQARRYPSLEIARYGLDVLALRVGAERVETPGM
jgi:hypothetical protein